MPSERTRQTAFDKVQRLLAQADEKDHYGQSAWAERLRNQAFAIERDYGGFDDIRASLRGQANRARRRREHLDILYALVMDPEVRTRFPRVRAWAGLAIDEIKSGGKLLGESDADVARAPRARAKD